MCVSTFTTAAGWPVYTETGALLQHAAGVEKGKQESGEKTLREGGTGHSDGDGDVTERYSDFSDFSEAAKPDSEATGLREGNNTRIRQISSAETTGDQQRADASARCPVLPCFAPCCPVALRCPVSAPPTRRCTRSSRRVLFPCPSGRAAAPPPLFASPFPFSRCFASRARVFTILVSSVSSSHRLVWCPLRVVAALPVTSRRGVRVLHAARTVWPIR